MMGVNDVLELLSLADSRGIEVRFDGGWGVDALMGRQTREHNDADLFVERKDGAAFIGLLQQNGFREVETSQTSSDHTVWEDGRKRIVDLHLFEYEDGGGLLFEGTVYPMDTFGAVGVIGGRKVSCIPPEKQVFFHTGYAHDEGDVQDVRLLCEQFGIPVPEEYKAEVGAAGSGKTLCE